MFIRKAINIAITSSLVLVAGTLSQPTHAADTIEQHIQKSIVIAGEAQPKTTLIQRMADENVPGLSIAVLKNGEIVWAKGFGIANSKTKRPVNEHTLFQAGSISKPIGALAALKLVEQGKLSLDEDVNKYLKGYQLTGAKRNTCNPQTIAYSYRRAISARVPRLFNR